MTQGFPGASAVNNLFANAGDARETSAITGLGRLPGEENGNPLATHISDNYKRYHAIHFLKSESRLTQ